MARTKQTARKSLRATEEVLAGLHSHVVLLPSNRFVIAGKSVGGKAPKRTLVGSELNATLEKSKAKKPRRYKPGKGAWDTIRPRAVH